MDRVGIPGSLNGKGIHRKLGEQLSIHRLPSKGYWRSNMHREVTDFCRFLFPLRLRKFTFKLGPSLKNSWMFQKNGSKEMGCERRVVSWWKEQWTRNSKWSKYSFEHHDTAWCPERILVMESMGKTWVLAFLQMLNLGQISQHFWSLHLKGQNVDYAKCKIDVITPTLLIPELLWKSIKKTYMKALSNKKIFWNRFFKLSNKM